VKAIQAFRDRVDPLMPRRWLAKTWWSAWVGSVALIASCAVAGCTSAGNKCGPTPRVNASWPGGTTVLSQCGGALGGLGPSPSPNEQSDTINITLHAGQKLTLTKGSGWSDHTVSEPVSDRPQVLRLDAGTQGNTIAVFEAVAPGFADIGAASDLRGNAPGGCFLGEVQVLP
jgi:hypothetical protein